MLSGRSEWASSSCFLGGILIELSLERRRIQLREDIAGVNFLPFDERDLLELPIDPGMYRDGVEGLCRTQPVQVNRDRLLFTTPGTTGARKTPRGGASGVRVPSLAGALLLPAEPSQGSKHGHVQSAPGSDDNPRRDLLGLGMVGGAGIARAFSFQKRALCTAGMIWHGSLSWHSVSSLGVAATVLFD